jgi:hypothetical protein
MAEGWLERSGQRWKYYSWRSVGLPGSLLVLVGRRVLTDSAAPKVGGLLMGAGCLLILAAVGLPMLIRCRVCGLQLQTSSAMRGVGVMRQAGFINSLAACPVCGDDGRAEPGSQVRWRASGHAGERPYWSYQRLVLAAVGTLLFLLASVVVGSWASGNPPWK